MERIAILTHENRMVGGLTFIFPIFRWESQLRDIQLQFDIFTDHNDKRILNYGVVIIIHRYFQMQLVNGIIRDKQTIKEYIGRLKLKGCKVIFFDAGDSSGSEYFDIIEDTVLFLKKQLLKNQAHYLLNLYNKSVRIWMKDTDIDKNSTYQPCKPEHLYKLRLGWNIGLADYRYNPIRAGIISNYIFTKLKKTLPSVERPILTSFRGRVHKTNKYAFQRNLLIDFLEKTPLPVITGKPLGRLSYLKEFEKCKAIVSPYGWGEICYRDFESFIKGALLIKPDMSHLITFPDFFTENSTYLPVDWHMIDLEDKLQDINTNYIQYIEMAKAGQDNFFKNYNDSELFVNHLKDIIKAVS
jgi:hypothetical protein